MTKARPRWPNWLLAGIVVAIIICLGGNRPWFAYFYVACLSLYLAWSPPPIDAWLKRFPDGKLWGACFLLVLIVKLAQAIPLPANVVAILAPDHDLLISQLPSSLPQPDGAVSSLAYDDSRHQLSLALTLAVFASFVAFRNNLKSRNDLTPWLYVLVVLPSVLVIVSILTSLSGVSMYEDSSVPSGLSGTFVNPNHFVYLLGLGVFVCLGLLTSDASRLSRRALWSCFAALALGIVLTNSRAGVLSVLAALMFYGLVMLKQRAIQEKYMAVAIGAALLVIVGVVTIFITSNSGFFSQVYVRVDLYTATLRLIFTHFVTGVGGGGFEWAFQSVKPASLGWAVYDHAHNDYLEFIVENGVSGVVVLFLAGIAFVKMGVRVIARHNDFALGVYSGLISMLVHSLIDFGFQIPAVQLVFFAGIAAIDFALSTRRGA